jgi:hypothetical protein
VEAKKQKSAVRGQTPEARPETPDPSNQIDFTLQELALHFIIPEVPDVAAANPAGYNKNLDALTDLEQLTTELAA